MQPKSKRWFPKQGDLVAVPYSSSNSNNTTKNCAYGIVMKETFELNNDNKFTGVWWDVFFQGNVKSLNIQIITPLWDSEGICLRN